MIQPELPHWADMLGDGIGWLTVCGYRPEPAEECKKAAKWHLWLEEDEGYIGACNDHIALARGLLRVADEHEWGTWCNLPGSFWTQAFADGTVRPIRSWCEQEHGDPLASLDLAQPQPHEQELVNCC
jgi:hypothetical protein